MTNVALQTSRFAFQKIGDGLISATAGQTATAGTVTSANEVIEPGDYNALLQRLDGQIPSDLANLFTSANYTAGTGVALTHSHPWAFWKLRLTLTNALITVTNANKYGSLEILDWPNTNLVVLSARMNLTVVKDNVGILAADTPHIAVGSAAASNTTLATTMIDTIEQVTVAGTLSAAAQKNGPHTAGNRYIAAGASNKLYLNAGTTGNSGGVDGSLTVSGTIDIFIIDTGTFS